MVKISKPVFKGSDWPFYQEYEDTCHWSRNRIIFWAKIKRLSKLYYKKSRTITTLSRTTFWSSLSYSSFTAEGCLQQKRGYICSKRCHVLRVLQYTIFWCLPCSAEFVVRFLDWMGCTEMRILQNRIQGNFLEFPRISSCKWDYHITCW